MLDGIGNDLADEDLYAESKHLFFVLACSSEDIRHIDKQLESLDSVVDCVLEQASEVTLFENCNFDFSKIVVK